MSNNSSSNNSSLLSVNLLAPAIVLTTCKYGVSLQNICSY